VPAHQRQSRPADLNDEEWLSLLRSGTIEVEGRMPLSSNAIFLVHLFLGDHEGRAVYKPAAGERELWDFPGGLYRREVAAFELDRSIGIHAVPAAVVRSDAPYGEGSFQRFIEARFDEHYFSLREAAVHHDALREIAAFDLLANNADRKGGHLLVDAHDKLWAIDNALTFHPDQKLRTVMWDFIGDEIPDRIVKGAAAIVAEFPQPLAALLSAEEQQALYLRAQAVLDRPYFPEPDDKTRLPWPLV
jgi:uncharacterized repeat protein (TIGR03843 family)